MWHRLQYKEHTRLKEKQNCEIWWNILGIDLTYCWWQGKVLNIRWFTRFCTSQKVVFSPDFWSMIWLKILTYSTPGNGNIIFSKAQSFALLRRMNQGTLTFRETSRGLCLFNWHEQDMIFVTWCQKPRFFLLSCFVPVSRTLFKCQPKYTATATIRKNPMDLPFALLGDGSWVRGELVTWKMCGVVPVVCLFSGEVES